MADILLATKLFLPPLPANALLRKQLWELLDQGLAPENRLLLVCAPAGYGKTTLLSEWVHNLQEQAGQDLSVAWLSLAREDNDLLEFFSFLAAGLEKSLPGVQASISMLLKSPQPLSPQTIVSAVLNEMARHPGELILVLDDYQLIHSSAIHEGIALLVDLLPPGVHLVLATRSDPPLPLHRYRARGQVVEVRSAELRFTPLEISHLIYALAGCSLSDTQAALLAERTEGWAAGVQLAGLSLRGKPDADAFIRSLSGSQRFFLDYLAEEVFNTQPPEIQRFLLGTSILERLNAELCEAVLDEGDSSNCQLLLETLEHANLFLIPLDDEQRWYRYHRLFHDLLQLRLKQSGQNLGLSAGELHQRASQWFEQQGWIADAVQHAILAGDHEKAASLVEQHTLELFSQGELAKLVGWVKLLPGDVANRRPWLKIYQAWATAFAGQIAETEQLLQQAEDALTAQASSGPVEEAQAQKIRAEAAVVRGMTAVMAGKVDEAFALVDLPEPVLRAMHPFARSGMWWSLGYAWRIRGELPKAISAFEHMLEIARQHGWLWTNISASVDLGACLRLGGKLRQAEAVYRQALDSAARRGAADLGLMGRLESFLANTLYEQNELEAARQAALASLTHNRLWQNANHTVHGYLVYAKIAGALGDQAGASQALDQAAMAAEQATIVSPLQAMLHTARLKRWLEAGEIAQALQWAHDQAAAGISGRPFDEAQAQINLGLARVQIALGKAAEAFRMLSEMESAAEARGLLNLLIEILVLKALCASDQPTAFAALAKALALGLPEGYMRVYLDEGSAALELLKAYRAAAPLDPEMRIYLDRLLAYAGAALEPEPARSAEQSLLTDRELGILRLMAQGLSNQEIGKRLFISPGTVKAHSAAIYRKLEVANRSEAVARAKDARLV